MPFDRKITRRTLLTTAGGLALASGITAPSILRAQSNEVIRIGHLTPLTGFLGPLGEYAVMAINLAVEEINASGGMMGRKVELVKEELGQSSDGVDQGRAPDRARQGRMIIGEISSASGLTIAQVANRMKKVFINTGCNSDALRGQDCHAIHVPCRRCRIRCT